ncbi:hypothetical protein ACQP25_16985 [Microtetraspora malaysiensis]|uniref:hypothetical protein n=1 Tax=Microtetraspora malaysiensis TaxID=161358 RepID=UPI003D9287DF
MTSSAITEARRRYCRNRRQKIRFGTWRGRVDAQPARAHVTELRRVWLVSSEAIALAAGVSTNAISHLVKGSPDRHLPPPARIGAHLSDLILTVTVDDLPDNMLINAVGSRRRLRALAVAGWPPSEIGSRADIDVTGLKLIRAGARTRVSMATVRRLRVVFDELERLDPMDHLRSSAVTLTRKKAASRGWSPAAAWADAIDEPNAKPWKVVRCSHGTCIHGSQDERLLCAQHLKVLQERGTLEGMRAQRNNKVMIENARFILVTDPPINPETEEIDRDLLAERLGTTWVTLERALLRANINLDKLRESA